MLYRISSCQQWWLLGSRVRLVAVQLSCQMVR